MKNTICVIPWVHLNILPKGKVSPCCMTMDFANYAGDLTTQSIEEIWNSEYMRDIRVQMLNGDEPKMCSRCFESECSSGQSPRLDNNKHFSEKLQEIPSITESNGHVDKLDLKYWDFRFSNLCNFKCRSCGPELSSAWLAESRDIHNKVITINGVDNVTNVEFLKKYINTVERIYFAGGEPLLMDEHWQILEMLDNAKRYDVSLTYSTNLSKLTYKNKNVLDYWKKWGRNVLLCPSIDEIDERAELVRSGTNWKVVEDNLRQVSELDVQLKFSPTVSVLNIFRLSDIINRMIDIGVVNIDENHYNVFSINVLESPHYYHISLLPVEYRMQIKENLENFIEGFNNRFNIDIRHRFLHLFWHLEKPTDQEAVNLFLERTTQLDNLRGENTFDVIPELKILL